MGERQAYAATILNAWHRSWTRPDGRWPWARWALSLLVPLSLLLWAVTSLIAPGDLPRLRIDVVSQTTGRGIEGALVQVGETIYRADANGRVVLEPQRVGSHLVASAEGHGTVERDVEEVDGEMMLSLSGVLVLGSVTDAASGLPVEGATIAILDRSGHEVTSTRTDASGTFVFTMIPEDAELAVRHDVYGETRQLIGSRRELRIQLAPPPVIGIIVDAAGQPVGDAEVSAGGVEAQTGPNGSFRLEGVGQGTALQVTDAGGSRASVDVQGTDLGTIVLNGNGLEATASPGVSVP